MSMESQISALANSIGLALKNTNASKISVTDIVDTLTSVETNKPLSAKQGKVLKDMMDNINTLLSSNDTSLDQLQEIVDFIKNNKGLIDSLGIANITGLQTALDGKASTTALNNLSTNVGATDTNFSLVFTTALNS